MLGFLTKWKFSFSAVRVDLGRGTRYSRGQDNQLPNQRRVIVLVCFGAHSRTCKYSVACVRGSDGSGGHGAMAGVG